MTNAEIKPSHFRVPMPHNPRHAKRYFSCSDTVEASDENHNAEPLYSQETVSALQKENEELRGHVKILREAVKQSSYALKHPTGDWIEWKAEAELISLKMNNAALQATAPKDE